MGYIKNRKELSTTKERKLIIDILEKTLSKNSTKKLLEKSVIFDANKNKLSINSDVISLGKGNIYIIGGGKAAGEMAVYLEKILGDKIKGGFVNVLEPIKLKTIKCNKVSHPHPTPTTFQAMKGLEKISSEIKKEDSIIFLLSGGASAMFALPPDEISASEFIEAQKTLVNSGLAIDDINCIRKHISQVKGGFITERFKENKVYTLALSDIVSGDISSLGSGPTDADRSTFKDAEAIIKKNKLKLPMSVIGYIRKGMQGKVRETIKIMPQNSKIYVLGDNRTLTASAIALSEEKRLRTQEIIWPDYTDAEKVSGFIAEHVERETSLPKIFIMGGELTTTPKKNSGKGGRNQHLILSLLHHLQKLPEPWAALAFNTDGTDFLKGIGGAIIDHNNAIKLNNSKSDISKYLESFDSYNYLRRVNSIIKTNPTNMNFCDLIIIVLGVYRTKRVNKK